jgi:NAD-dependent deacetylase
MGPGDNERLERVAGWLRERRSVLFITGAGLSADSGLPTYRGVGGLYQDQDTEEGMPIEEALSGATLASRPEIAWRHILRIEAACREARFNRGHEVIAGLERRLPRVWVLTQNIDGFHRAAGSRNLIEIHGDVHRLRCTACSHRQAVRDYRGFERVPPPCPDCGAPLRPDVVFFGESLPAAELDTLRRELRRGFDLVFSVGTTSVFPYISAPVLAAHQAGIPTVEIDPGETTVSALVDVKLAGGAAHWLDRIWQRVQAGEPA